MKLTSITIENFRGIKDKQVIPITNFSSIVGKNDSGKSIVVNAIASFLDPKTYKIVESDFNKVGTDITFEGYFYHQEVREILGEKIKLRIKKEDGLDEFL
jgi:AAA15 family ATPase/GTPase